LFELLKKHTFDTSKKKENETCLRFKYKQNKKFQTTSAYNRNSKLGRHWLLRRNLETADTIEGNSVLKANYVTKMATIVLRMTRDLK
jgi:hypothetical protein